MQLLCAVVLLQKIKKHVCPFFSVFCVSPNTTDITGWKDSQYLFSQSLCFKASSLLVKANNNEQAMISSLKELMRYQRREVHIQMTKYKMSTM